MLRVRYTKCGSRLKLIIPRWVAYRKGLQPFVYARWEKTAVIKEVFAIRYLTLHNLNFRKKVYISYRKHNRA